MRKPATKSGGHHKRWEPLKKTRSSKPPFKASLWKKKCTEHQLFFDSREWKLKCREIWIRDLETCQRCFVKHKEGMKSFNTHHIRPWAKFPQYRMDNFNLILLCPKCHTWVHSRRNKDGAFIIRD